MEYLRSDVFSRARETRALNSIHMLPRGTCALTEIAYRKQQPKRTACRNGSSADSWKPGEDCIFPCCWEEYSTVCALTNTDNVIYTLRDTIDLVLTLQTDINKCKCCWAWNRVVSADRNDRVAQWYWSAVNTTPPISRVHVFTCLIYTWPSAALSSQGHLMVTRLYAWCNVCCCGGTLTTTVLLYTQFLLIWSSSLWKIRKP